MEADTCRPRVLIVDDEQLNRDLMKRVLKYDYDVIAAEDAADALALLRDNPDIRLVLCDQIMPDILGTRLAGQVRELRDDIRFVILTGYDEDPEIHTARNAGVIDAVMCKPWRSTEVKSLLRELLDGRR